MSNQLHAAIFTTARTARERMICGKEWQTVFWKEWLEEIPEGSLVRGFGGLGARECLDGRLKVPEEGGGAGGGARRGGGGGGGGRWGGGEGRWEGGGGGGGGGGGA